MERTIEGLAKDRTEETKSRHEVRLPSIPDGYCNGFGFMSYMRDFWSLNGYDTSTYHQGSNLPRPFEHKIIIEQGNDRPDVIVSASYEDLRDEGRWERRDAISELKIVGNQTHTIFLPSTAALAEPEEFLKVYYVHTTGVGHPNALPFPVVTYRGEEQIPYRFRFDDDAYSQALKDALQAFHDLIS